MQRATITLHNGPLAFTAVDARPDPGGGEVGVQGGLMHSAMLAHVEVH